MKRIVVLGASGSIGLHTIRCIEDFPDLFTLAGFSVAKNKDVALQLSRQFPQAKVLEGPIEDIEKNIEPFLLACNADIAVNGISGAAGLKASIACIHVGLDLALANKESIVLAGHLLRSDAKKKDLHIIPVDSEHSALFCLINAFGAQTVERLILTASGGPFRTLAREQFSQITVEAALKHPNWKMGGKISIDSSTLANKALEVIEAVQLFDVPTERITVVVHPESIVHSLIQLHSHQIYGQMSIPDMRFPILYALCYPNAACPYLSPLDFSKAFSLTFEPPRYDDFPLLKMGFDVAKAGAGYPIAFNAANEVAVQAFLEGRCTFVEIPLLVEKVLQADWSSTISEYSQVFALDKKARAMCIF